MPCISAYVLVLNTIGTVRVVRVQLCKQYARLQGRYLHDSVLEKSILTFATRRNKVNTANDEDEKKIYINKKRKAQYIAINGQIAA